MSAVNDTQQVVEGKLANQAQHHENISVQQQAFNRRHSLTANDPTSQRRRSSVPSIDSMRKSFNATNIQMVAPIAGHLEISDDYAGGNGIDDIAVSWFVWLVAATASIAGSLFGYDTGRFFEIS